jgi:hypothetical protein
LVWRLTASAPSIHLFGDKWLSKRFFIKQAETLRVNGYFTPMNIQLQRQEEKPVFHATNGAEAEQRLSYQRNFLPLRRV